MTSNRRSILNLIAIGRITPAEAERLLATWNQGRETLLALIAGFIFASLPELRTLLPALARAAGTLLPLVAATLHQARNIITYLVGGNV
jgi:hypothetical protein